MRKKYLTNTLQVFKTLQVVIFFLPLYLSGQKVSEFDSLRTVVGQIKNDTLKADKLLELAENTNWRDVHIAEKFAREALILSRNLNYVRGMAYSKFQLSILFKDSDFEIAEKLILESLSHARKIQDSLLIGNIYNTIGNLKDNVNESNDAIRFYNQSLEVFDAIGQDSLKAKVYNNLGIIYDNRQDFVRAWKSYFNAVKVNRKYNNLSGLAINYLNIGYSGILSSRLDSAYVYLNKSYELAKEKEFNRLLPYIYNNYSDYYYLKQDYQKAIDFAHLAEKNAKEQDNLLQEKQALLNLKEVYVATNDMANAFNCAEKFNIISDSINRYNKLKELDFLELKLEFEAERKQQQLEGELLKAEIARKELTILLIVSGAAFIILLFVFLYFQQLNRTKRKALQQKATFLEKQKIEQKLEYKNKELTTNVMYLLRKNEFISNISQKLKRADLKSSTSDKNPVEQIITELDRSISEDNWTDFEVRFQEVHVDFYNTLSKQFPELTPNELRLCAFLRLNMTSKEIANITYQSLDSLKTARYRLRKKLGLSRDDNLVAFLTKI